MDDKINLGWQTSISAAFVSKLPTHIDCKRCGQRLVTIDKDYLAERVKIQIHFTNSPEIVNAVENKGRVRCESCGAKNTLDLRLFRVAQPPVH
ncbi:MAG: hypothetical protein HY313_00380 [Acidobacteria bacterium]|nr:hypothetical protein [Acidobacteriota bacterium]